ncbi:hypothetical protein ACGVWS_15980, partial [Enterobacteriaceae bacterium LUAb1]
MKRVEYLVYERNMTHLEPDNFKNVDQIIFFSVSPNEKGNLFNSENDRLLFNNKLNYLKTTLLSGSSDKEIYLGIGSLDKLLLSGPVDSGTNHAFNIFLGEVRQLVTDNHFSGTDLDWEGHNMTVQDYTSAVYCLQMPGITGKPVSVSIGYYLDNTDQYFEKAARSACSSVNIQCYGDRDTNVRDFKSFLSSVASNLHKYNIPKSKVNIGLPLYVSDNGDYSQGWMDYVNTGGNP